MQSYEASAPAPDEQHQRGDEVDEKQCSSCQKDEVIVHSKREVLRTFIANDRQICNLCVTSLQTTVIGCFHLPSLTRIIGINHMLSVNCLENVSLIASFKLVETLKIYKRFFSLSGRGPQ